MACWESDWRKRAHPQQAVIDSAPQGILRRRKTHLTEGNASFFCELHDIFDILKKEEFDYRLSDRLSVTFRKHDCAQGGKPALEKL